MNRAADSRFNQIREKEKYKNNRKHYQQYQQCEQPHRACTASSNKKELEKINDTKKSKMMKSPIKVEKKQCPPVNTPAPIDNINSSRKNISGWNTWKITTCDKVNNLLTDPRRVCSTCGRKQVHKQEAQTLHGNNEIYDNIEKKSKQSIAEGAKSEKKTRLSEYGDNKLLSLHLMSKEDHEVNGRQNLASEINDTLFQIHQFKKDD